MTVYSQRDYIGWCRVRALDILEKGDLEGAYVSFLLELGKCEETKDLVYFKLTTRLQAAGMLNTSEEVRDHLNRFK